MVWTTKWATQTSFVSCQAPTAMTQTLQACCLWTPPVDHSIVVPHPQPQLPNLHGMCWLQASNGTPPPPCIFPSSTWHQRLQAPDPWRIPSRSPSVDDQLSPNTLVALCGRITLCITIHGPKMVHSPRLTWNLILKGLSFSSHFNFHVECEG